MGGEAMRVGYDRPLYILAFDHRSSFEELAAKAGVPESERAAKISEAKRVIFEGFMVAVDRGAPRDAAGILVDEQYGADVARAARERGYILAMPVEKSGQKVFDFEYGEQFGEHILAFDPTFSKVLVRYNPDDSPETKRIQLERLKRLHDWLRERERRFLLELLVPATKEQLEVVGGDSERYDREVRPELTLQAIDEFYAADIVPDIWKIEGLDRREDCERMGAKVRSGGRDAVSCVVLGRGADAARVDHWLRMAAGVPGYVGFAIGRTLWWDGVQGYLNGTLTREVAAEKIAANYLRAIDLYVSAARASVA
jgi:myo-inositol catabolism protein IolC